MSRRRNLERHRESLAEIRDIMNSMKSLAYMETRKLSRFLDAQRAVVQSIEDVAADFLGFHPDVMPEVKAATPAFVVFGTERGFCGDFNHALLKHLESARQKHAGSRTALLAIGRKLHTLLEGDARVLVRIGGASVMEEVTVVLNQLVDEIISLQHSLGAIDVYCLYHGDDDQLAMHRLLPPFQDLRGTSPRFAQPPIQNLPPAAFLIELTDQYLFAALYAMLYTSLMMENHHRVSHLEGAVKHLDDRSEALARRCNALRQEEIIEEIEVILLNAADPGVDSHTQEDIRL